MSNNNGQKEIEIMIALLPYIIFFGILYLVYEVVFAVLGVVIAPVFDLAFGVFVFVFHGMILLFFALIILLILISAFRAFIKIISKKDAIGGGLVALGTVATYYFFDEISMLIFHVFLVTYVNILKFNIPSFLISDLTINVVVATIYLIPLSLYLFPNAARSFFVEKYDEFLVYFQENINQETRQKKESSYDDFEESPHQSQANNAKPDDDFSYDGGRFSDDRFSTESKKKRHETHYRAAHDPATPEAEAMLHLKQLRRDDAGETEGIKALPKPL